MFVEVAFESFVDVVDIGDAGLDQHLTGFFGTLAAAAYQNHRRAAVVAFYHAAKHEFANIGDKMRIHHPIGFIDPGHMHRAFGVADEQVFHAGANVDEQGARILLADFPRLSGRDGFQLRAHAFNLRAVIRTCQSILLLFCIIDECLQTLHHRLQM